MNNKKALVLCGGGARGGYHIGVWKALKEINYKPNIITGTSVGALNGALLAIKEDKLAQEIWENMTMDTVFEKKETRDINTISSPSEFLLEIGKIGGINPKPLKELVNKLADEKKFRNSDIEFGLVLTAIRPMRKVEKFIDEMEEGKIPNYILASSACFPIMQMYEINGTRYVDGGYTDNIPYEAALKRGATDIVIVDMPGIFKLKKLENVNAKIHYVFPKHDLGNFIIFNKEVANKDIRLGYLDTMKVFNKLEGTYYSFYNNSNMEACGYNKNIKKVYKKIFTGLPTIGTLERLATNKVVNYIKKFNEEIFSNMSDVLKLLEIAAQSYEIDYLKIYNFNELSQIVMEKYRETIKSEEYKWILSISKIIETVDSLDEVSRLIKQYDAKNIIAYLVFLLTLPQLTQLQKNQILVVSMIKPSLVCSAIFIASFLNRE